MSRARPKIFGFWNGIYDGLYMGVVITETGIVLAINNVYSMNELPSSLENNFTVIYDEYYPHGYEFEFVEPVRYQAHKQLQLAIAIGERNKKDGKQWRYFQRKRREHWAKTGQYI